MPRFPFPSVAPSVIRVNQTASGHVKREQNGVAAYIFAFHARMRTRIENQRKKNKKKSCIYVPFSRDPSDELQGYEQRRRTTRFSICLIKLIVWIGVAGGIFMLHKTKCISKIVRGPGILYNPTVSGFLNRFYHVICGLFESRNK